MYKVITEPVAEPISLEDARQHLRLPGAFDIPPATHHMDSRILRWIKSARQAAERHTGRVLCPQTIEIALDAFPTDGDIELPPPVISVVSVTYADTDGTEQTMATTEYALDDYQEPSWLTLAYGSVWPSTNRVNAVKVRINAGYSIVGDISQTHPLPVSIESALLLIVEYLFEGGSEKPEALDDFMERIGLRAWRLEMGFA